MKNSLLYIAALALGAAALGACDDNFERPPMVVPSCDWEANTSIKELKEMYWANVSGSPVQIGLTEKGDSMIVRGRIASSDEAGNVYNSIVLQDKDGEYAINFYVSYSDSYRRYKFGEDVAVNLTGMYVGGYNGLMQFGALKDGAMATMSEDFFKVQARPNGWPEPEKVDTILCTMDDIMGATAAADQMMWQSRLVRIQGMTLKDQGQPWAEAESTNRYAADDKGQEMLLRISNYATFKSDLIPTGKGDIVGILSYYNGWQLVPIDGDAFFGFTPAVVGPVEPLPEANITIAALKAEYWDNSKSDYVSTITAREGDIPTIIEGTVISSDESGNIYKSLVVADESAAVLFGINDGKLWSKYKVGQRLRINVTGMNIGRYRNLMQIGAGQGDQMGRMELGTFRSATQLIGDPAPFTVQPKVTTIEVLNASKATQEGQIQWQSQLVKLEGVHFAQPGEPFVSGNQNTNRDLLSAAGAAIIVRTSNYATFKDELLPVGTGNVTAIVGQFNNDMQLQLINSDGCADFDGVNPGESSDPLPEANVTIASLKSEYWDNSKSDYYTTITARDGNDTPAIIEGTIISSDESGNVFKSLIVADESAAVLFAINDNKLYSSYKYGQRIRINVTGMTIGRYRNLMQIGAPNGTEMGRMTLAAFKESVQLIGEPDAASVKPVATTIEVLNAAKTSQDGMIQWQSRLVKLEGVHFADAGQPFVNGNTSTNRDLLSASGESIIVRTSQYATFKDAVMPAGTGNVIAIVGQFNNDMQLQLLDADACSDFSGQ